MSLEQLTELYQQCFPEKNAEAELQSFTNSDFKFEILDDAAFIIYNIVSPDEAEIFDIGTIPAMRKTGLANKLIDKTIVKLKEQNITTLYLEVAEDNPNAIALYNKCGFVKFNIRKDYYKRANGRVNALLMKKSI